MKDYDKTSWRDFNKTRKANLELQLMKTRDNLNKIKCGIPCEESLETLQTREKTILQKLAEIDIEDIQEVALLDKEYLIVDIVSEIYCDIYGMPRHHCTEKDNFDICMDCFSKISHPHPTYIEKYCDSAHHKRITAAPSLAELVYTVFQCFAERPCLGYKEGGTFKWIPFKEVFKKSAGIGTAIVSPLYMGTRKIFDSFKRNKYSLQLGDAIAIHSRNSIEWISADLGSVLNGLLVVPIHHVVRDEYSLLHILNNCQVKVVFCEMESTDLFLKLQKSTPSLQQVIVFSSNQKRENWEGLEKISELEEFGNAQPFQVRPLAKNGIVSIIHTSGSTGKPKGAPFTDKYLRDYLCSFLTSDPIVEICFEPLAHISEREGLQRTLCSGGRTALIDVSDTLLEDIAVISPRTVSTTPRFWNVFHTKYQRTLLLEQSIAPPENAELVKTEILKRFKGLLGTRINDVSCGGAASSPQLIQFLKECFGDSVVSDGYGSTEAGSIAGKGGYLLSGVGIKLVDVPELGYLSTDKPYPRGELYVQTKNLIQGYYNNPEDTNRLFVDGWFCTGDIVEQLEVRRIKIIDRRKNFFKLSQGEYVAAEQLENKYLQSPFVDQIFITCGDITKYEQNSVFAVVVPQMAQLIKWATQNNLEHTDIEKLCRSESAKNKVLESLREVAAVLGLPPYEVPENIILEPHEFTIENSKMTSSNKLARPVLEKFYVPQVNAVLEATSKEQQENILQDILTDILGYKLPNLEDKNSSIIALGGDSLSAIKLSSTLNSTLQINIPPHILLNKNMTLAKLLEVMKKENKVQQLLHQQVNEANKTEILLDMDLLKCVEWQKSELRHLVSTVRNVLLTGATGFVGAFLLQQILQATEYTVYCLVRPNSKSGNAKSGYNRLKEAMEGFHIWSELTEKEISRIDVVEGDLGKSLLGLPVETYSRISENTDVVFHCGAVVNHVLPYSEIKQENVIGTKHILEFCSKSRNSPRLNFISTLSCIPTVPPTSSEQEILEYPEKRRYEQSKFVAEKLVLQAFENKYSYGSIFRLGMVGWNSATGVGNPKDWIFMLIYGIMKLNKVPASSSKFELLPVDVICKVLLKLGLSEKNIGGTYGILEMELVPFRSFAKHISGIQELPFVDWVNFLRSEIKANNNNSALNGLLHFMSGIPDETKYQEEIAKKANKLADILPPNDIQATIPKYIAYISSFM